MKDFSIKTARKLWRELADIPVNENDELDQEWRDFGRGTDKIEVWLWFEETFNISVVKDLMKLT